MLLSRFIFLIISLALLPLNALAQANQQSLQITEQAVAEFRQISVRVLAAYKSKPRYIGSTEEWHLFLKKERRTATGKEFSSIFGYKVKRSNNSVENSWELTLPQGAVNPDNCPEIVSYTSDKTGFTIPPGIVSRQHCLNR